MNQERISLNEGSLEITVNCPLSTWNGFSIRITFVYRSCFIKYKSIISIRAELPPVIIEEGYDHITFIRADRKPRKMLLIIIK